MTDPTMRGETPCGTPALRAPRRRAECSGDYYRLLADRAIPSLPCGIGGFPPHPRRATCARHGVPLASLLPSPLAALPRPPTRRRLPCDGGEKTLGPGHPTSLRREPAAFSARAECPVFRRGRREPAIGRRRHRVPSPDVVGVSAGPASGRRA